MSTVKRLAWPLVATAALVTVSSFAVPDSALAGGRTAPSLSFFSGGDGGYASWLATSDQPSQDTDKQAIQLNTTNDAPSYSKGYAGVMVHHVDGIPVASFPDSEFWVKTPSSTGPSQGSPRLVVEFQDATGKFVGYGDLRPGVLTASWQDVSDQRNYPSTAWDVMGGPCSFRYNTTWSTVQSCFAGDTTLSIFLVADAYGIHHLIDDLTVDGKTFTEAADNGAGNNDPAGPSASNPSLLPSILPLP